MRSLASTMIACAALLSAPLCAAQTPTCTTPTIQPSEDRDEVAFDTLTLRTSPTLATKHYSLAGLTISQSTTALGQCKIDRISGAVLACTFAGDVENDVKTAASRRSQALRFCTQNLAPSDPDHPRPLLARIPFTIDPAERLPEPQFGEPTIDKSEFTWARMPSMEALMDFYPDRPLARSIEADTELPCLVLADTSFICGPARVLPREGGKEIPADIAEEFQRAAGRSVRLFTLKPARKNGETAAGARVDLVVKFRMPNY